MMDFSTYAHKKTHTNLFAFLLVIGIAGLVGWVVFLITQKNLAANMRGQHLDIVCLVIFLVFTAAALGLYFGTRFKVQAGYRNKVFLLEVSDPALKTPLTIHDPYTLKLQWSDYYVTNRKKMKMLYVTVFDLQGIPLVSFRASLGSIYSAPMNFEYVGESTHQMVLADKIYDLGRTPELGGVLSRHLDMLKKKEMQA